MKHVFHVFYVSYLFLYGNGGPFHPAQHYILPPRSTRDGDNWDTPSLPQVYLCNQIKKQRKKS